MFAQIKMIISPGNEKDHRNRLENYDLYSDTLYHRQG